MEPHSRHHAGTFRLPQALLLLLSTAVAQTSPSPTASANQTLVAFSPLAKLSDIKARLSRLQRRLLFPIGVGFRDWRILVGMVALTTVCGIVPVLWSWNTSARRTKRRGNSNGSIADASDSNGFDAVATDPGLLKKHSSIRSYTVPETGITYPAIRTFYRPHPQGDKLPSKPCPVPLLVFVHGLGGSVAQFHPILVSLVNLAPCLAIDLPGCGVSDFAPRDWEAYTPGALVQLLATAIEAHRDKDAGQGVILIGHSMGCSLSALLASSTSPYAHLLSTHVMGLVAICPNAAPPSKQKTAEMRRLLAIPEPIFDLWRRWDRRGGISSLSVARFVGSDAEEETKKLQLRFNEQSKTPVYRRMGRGCLPDYSKGTTRGGLPGKEIWAGLGIPVFLAAGEADAVTPPGELKKIAAFLGKDIPGIENPPEALPDSAAPIDATLKDPPPERKHQDSGVDTSDIAKIADDNASTSSFPSSTGETVLTSDLDPAAVDNQTTTGGLPQPLPRRLVLKTTVLPKPASHALLYAPSSSRTLAGLIGTFLATHIDPRLSLGWQLQYLTTEGKWDVKNLNKWKAVQPVSSPIAGVFRAMKTLREVDEQHSPKIFVKEWRGKIRAVVDISHESPVYDPKGLDDGGIRYYKFPTVSKLPPTVDEVNAFITLIDKIRAEHLDASTEAAVAEAQSNSTSAPLSSPPAHPSVTAKIEPSTSPPVPAESSAIGVHCHYGFNRTGFFLVCYLVERLGYRLHDAIDEFKNNRPPGIRHEHFIDALYVRYCVGLQRAPTL